MCLGGAIWWIFKKFNQLKSYPRVQAQSGKKPHKPNSLAPQYRLRRSREISHCQKVGRKLHTKHFLLIVKRSESDFSRLALAVTLKIDKRAVRRNLIKRRVREVFRVLKGRFNRSLDVVVVARHGVQKLSFDGYSSEITGALQSGGYLKPCASE
jgi:ribonuclease P protein component